MTALIDGISSYFLDHCPDDVLWEDFDPEIDSVRAHLQSLFDGEAELIA